MCLQLGQSFSRAVLPRGKKLATVTAIIGGLRHTMDYLVAHLCGARYQRDPKNDHSQHRRRRMFSSKPRCKRRWAIGSMPAALMYLMSQDVTLMLAKSVFGKTSMYLTSRTKFEVQSEPGRRQVMEIAKYILVISPAVFLGCYSPSCLVPCVCHAQVMFGSKCSVMHLKGCKQKETETALSRLASMLSFARNGYFVSCRSYQYE